MQHPMIFGFHRPGPVRRNVGDQKAVRSIIDKAAVELNDFGVLAFVMLGFQKNIEKIEGRKQRSAVWRPSFCVILGWKCPYDSVNEEQLAVRRSIQATDATILEDLTNCPKIFERFWDWISLNVTLLAHRANRL